VLFTLSRGPAVRVIGGETDGQEKNIFRYA